MPQRSFAKSLNDFPIFRVLCGTVAGIILEENFSFGIVAGLCGIAFFLSLLCFSALKKLKHKYAFLDGLSVYLFWVFFGIFIVNFQKTEKPDIQHFNGKIKYAVVEMPLEEKSKSFKTTLSLIDSLSDKKYKILAYFEKGVTKPECGDLTGFVADLEPLKSSQNPLDFDFADYMRRQGVYFSVYIKKDGFKILQKGYQKNFRFYGSKLREKLLSIYKSCDFDTRELSVLEALTLGYKADLDEETISAFQKSGSMHILAVSGLHTGIILLIINILLKSLDRSKKGKFLKFIITVVMLWLFAAITGFSPSVCRSALMFSLTALALALNRASSTYITLAFSAFILLVFEPMLLFNVGFLLSYFAVLSIIAVVPLLEDIFYLKRNFIKDGFWIVILKNSANYFIGILLVSLAAQIGTAMLSISTFNQFPLYFMLTNVIVIPVAFLIMISAVLLLLTSGISYIAMALNFLLKLLINSVTWIENLPGACAEGIFVTKISMCLLYVVILFLTLFFIYKNVKTLKFALSTALILVLLTGYFGMFSSKTDCLTVWNKEKYTCISYLKQDSCVVLTSKRGSTEGVFLSPIKNLMSIKGTKKLTVLQTNVIEKFSDFYFQICGKNVLVLNNAKQLEMLDGLKVDLLIITENVNFNISRLLEKINPEKVIFASSNRENYVREKAEEFLSHNIKVHNVNISGAFVEGFFSEVIWRY